MQHGLLVIEFNSLLWPAFYGLQDFEMSRSSTQTSAGIPSARKIRRRFGWPNQVKSVLDEVLTILRWTFRGPPR